MEKITSRLFWILGPLLLILIAYFLASGTSELIAAKVSDLLPTPKASEVPTITTAAVAAVPNGNIILRNNIFDHTARNLDKDPEPPPAVYLPEGPMPLVPCSTSAKLLTLLASSSDPAHSWAMLEVGGKRTSVRPGDGFEGRTVSAISWRYLLLQGANDECYIDMFLDPNAPPPPPPPTAATAGATADAAAATTDAAPSALANEIQVESDTERTVTRAVVDQALANPTMFANSVRVRPYRQDGKVTGFRLRTIDKGSPLELLGAQRGDIIHSVNGVSLTSVDQALAAYQGLRSENQLTFTVTRRGQPVDLKINIK
ncbi:MAG: PDZ domain-containing protein [Myxococcales bacterium]|nr:PDZ domain-containing protein [Myxococcales bacterium]